MNLTALIKLLDPNLQGTNVTTVDCGLLLTKVIVLFLLLLRLIQSHGNEKRKRTKFYGVFLASFHCH